MENRVKVKIFGSTYNIQGDAEPEYIVKLAEYVNEKMKEVSNNLPSGNQLQIAILAALNIADEYFQLRETKSHLISDLEKKTNALIHMLDEGLIGDVYSATYGRRDISYGKSSLRQDF
ncbi:MAG: cell division protein ZapA [Spirochaetes bacterium]|nr:cell division protein ZapA [Spirochaetota bacterium]